MSAEVQQQGQPRTSVKSLPDGPTDVFLKIQLPNDSTTVIIVNQEMMMWEIMNVIAAKKQLIPSQHFMKVLFSDGKEEVVQSEKPLGSYTNVDRLVVLKSPAKTPASSSTTAPATKLKPGETKPSGNFLIPNAASKQTTFSTLQFPRTLTEHDEITRRMEKQGSSTSNNSEYHTTSKKSGGTNALKTLSMMIFRKEGDAANSSSVDVNSLDSNGLSQKGSPSESRKSLASISSFDEMMKQKLMESQVAKTTEKTVGDLSSVKTISMSSLISTKTQESRVPAGDSESINTEGPSGGRNTDAVSLKSGRMGSVENTNVEESMSKISEESTPTEDHAVTKRRHRTSSTPTTGATLKRTTFKPSRPRSNTDGISSFEPRNKRDSYPLPPSTTIEGSATSIATENGNSPVEDKRALINVTLPNFRSTSVKVPQDLPMEAILSYVCEKNNIDFKTYTLQFNDVRSTTVEMDRPVAYYFQELKISEVFIVPGEKVYRTKCVNENGVDVLLLQIQNTSWQVMAGTPEKLIERLTDETEGTSDKNCYLDTLLLTFRSFMKPADFLHQLIDRYNCMLPPDATPDDVKYFNEMKIPTQARVVFAIKWWVENHWHDFAVSSSLRKDLDDFQLLLSDSEETRFINESERLLTLIEQQSAKYEEMYSYYRMVERRGKTMQSMFLELTPEEIAQQLCVHNFKIFRNIHPIEFLQQIWKREDEETPSLNFFIERFDKESYWAVTEIVSQKDMKKRVNVLKNFILTAKACQDNNNFFSMFAIVAGLSQPPVTRLKKTWEALPEKVKKTYAEVEALLDPSRNMKNYRDCLALASPPIVPFLPIYLKDLTFMNDGNASKVHGMVNFDKLRMMANRVKDIASLAGIEYKYEAKPAVQNYIAKPPVEKNMAKLKEMSAECEKPT
ncbi:hypothetical protein HDV05_004940 [Chytridiales sp. JEL 0842]|nr:hypothetical protein HDV05_004940 [Chytridiales sp. JEL 0842]